MNYALNVFFSFQAFAAFAIICYASAYYFPRIFKASEKWQLIARAFGRDVAITAIIIGIFWSITAPSNTAKRGARLEEKQQQIDQRNAELQQAVPSAPIVDNTRRAASTAAESKAKFDAMVGYEVSK